MSISSLIDSGTGKIYDNLIPQGGGVALTKGQLISANDQNPPVEVAVPVGVNGTILMADSTQVDGLRWAVVPGAVALAQGQLLSGNLAGDPTTVVAPVLPAQAGWVLSADGTAGAAGTNMAWKPPTGAGGLLTANLPLFDDATTNPNTIGINFSAAVGEIPYGTAAKVGTLTNIPNPASSNQYLGTVAGVPTWKNIGNSGITGLLPIVEVVGAGDESQIAIGFTQGQVGQIPYGGGTVNLGTLTNVPTSGTQFLGVSGGVPAWKDIGASGSITATFPLIESAGVGNASNIAIDYNAKGDLTVGASGAPTPTGVILPIGATDGQVLEVYAGAPSGMRWATPAPPSGGPTINRSNAATVEILQPQSLNETMILVAEEPGASWDAVESQGGDTAPYELEFTTPWFKNFQNPAANDAGLQGVVEYINGARTIRLDIINQGSGSILTLGHLVFEEYNAPARVYGYIGPEGASSLMGNSIIIVGAFSQLIYTGPNPAPPLLCSQILGVDFQNTQSITAFNLPSPNVGTALGLSGFGDQGYCSTIQYLPGTTEYIIGGKFSNILCSPAVPGSGGYMSLATYNTTTNNYELSTAALAGGLGVRLNGGPGTVNDIYFNAATFSIVVVGEFDELVVDANTNIPAPANSHGLAKWSLPLGPVSPWGGTPTGTPTPVPDGICLRPMVSQGAGILVVCGSSGIPVAYNIATNTSTALTGTYPSPAIPFSFNCAVGGTTDIGVGQVAYDFILYNDTTNLVCYVYYFSAANGTVATALTPAPTGFIPDDTGGVILNGGIYLFIDYNALPVVNLLQVAAKGSIYQYASDSHASIDFTLGTVATPFIGFIENGTLYHTVSFNGPTCPQSQSYISNSGKTAWIQIGDKTAGITYS
jgi:hypothetical protein